MIFENGQTTIVIYSTVKHVYEFRMVFLLFLWQCMQTIGGSAESGSRAVRAHTQRVRTIGICTKIGSQMATTG